MNKSYHRIVKETASRNSNTELVPLLFGSVRRLIFLLLSLYFFLGYLGGYPASRIKTLFSNLTKLLISKLLNSKFLNPKSRNPLLLYPNN